MATQERPATQPTAEDAWALVWQVFQADKSRRWKIISDFGLTPMQGMALGVLDAERPPTMSELAAHMHCDNSSLTGVVDRLEAIGVAERVPAPGDRRARCVALTAKGRELQARFREAMRPAPPHLQHLTADEAAQLHGLLRLAVDRHAAASGEDAAA
ncbi:MarR family winged helix-turn-helix transcriptional regulator [Conexibacter sp. SYSU D00693]|uniref:MarR family winged helix-turn-helix transcriptional regulator n=1 Tax=Conexibacter sp. SYSU D00693 TaxID=2812560 RepID=UPI00196A21C0|nr:MarR family transcriptional regulator [Conexibacter sp. SYSU D00693]